MSATSSAKPGSKEVVLVASGDSRLSANQRCWPAQQALEKAVDKAFAQVDLEALDKALRSWIQGL